MKKSIIISVLVVILLLIGGGYAVAKYTGTKSLKEHVKEYLQKANLSDRVKISDYSYEPITGKAVIRKITIDEPETDSTTYITAVIINSYKVPEGYSFPTQFDVEIKGIKNTRFKGLESSTRISYIYDPEKKQLLFKNFETYSSLHMLKIPMKFGNVSPELFEKDEDEQQTFFKLFELQPEEIKIEYIEKGLLSWIIEETSQKEGKDPKQFKEEMYQAILETAEKADSNSIKTLLEAVAYMLKNKKGKLVINIKAKDKVTIRELATTVVLAQALGMSPKELMQVLNEKFDTQIQFNPS
ncbi:hypothetical protein [Persephonella sp.]